MIIGYDNQNVYMMDPSTHGNYAFVPREEFLARWHDSDEHREVIRYSMTFQAPTSPVYQPHEIKKME